METDPTRRVVEKLGGVAALARALGHANPTTVHGWVRRKRVPSAQIPNVMKVAAEREIPLTYDEFFESVGSPSNEAA